MKKTTITLLIILYTLTSCKTTDFSKNTCREEFFNLTSSDMIGWYTGYLIEKDSKTDIKFRHHVRVIIRDSSMICLVGFDLSTLVKVSGNWKIKNDTIALYSKKPQYDPWYRGKYAEGTFYFRIIDKNTLLFFPDNQFYTNPTWKKRQKSVILKKDN